MGNEIYLMFVECIVNKSLMFNFRKRKIMKVFLNLKFSWDNDEIETQYSNNCQNMSFLGFHQREW